VAGFVEAPTFYPYLSGRKNLELFASLDGGDSGSRIDDALETVQLGERAGDKVKGYSHGMKQRLGIASALLRNPRLLLLDEPATGLDPAGMRDMRELIRDLGSQGITVLLSSHLMTEVEELCNRVAIVRRGRIVYEGSLTELRSRAGVTYRLRTADDARARRVVEAQPGIDEVGEGRAGGLTFKAADERAVAALSLALAESRAPILELTPQQATLEDLFFQLTEDGSGAPKSRVGAERRLKAAV
jgi:ABC-2 type transport system ATP-binding protein